VSTSAPGSPPWWALLPPVTIQVPCGPDRHQLRWEQGRLIAADHADVESELVLAALGGDRAECVELAKAWGARSDDLEVLAAGSRSAADKPTITADEIDAFRELAGPTGYFYAGATAFLSSSHRAHRFVRSGRHWPWHRLARRRATYGGSVGRGQALIAASGSPASYLIAAPAGHPSANLFPAAPKLDHARAQQLELLSLLALGSGFQLRLSATVAAAWADGGSRAADRAAGRPALVAALAGRLAPAAKDWLGIDPGQVDVALHEGAGWGQLTMAGQGSERQLCAALPVEWLASVWAAGLALVGGHLIVAVTEADWPAATVLGVREPGTEPVILKVRAAADGWTAAGRR
jgi:hypothetical protein